MSSRHPVLFLALMPDPLTARAIGRRADLTCERHGLRSRRLGDEQFHVSLFGLGSDRPETVAWTERVAPAVRFRPFELTFDRALSFRQREKCPFVLTGQKGLETLRVFHAHLGGILKRAGLPLPDRLPFTPHLTLVWDHRRIPGYPLLRPLTWHATNFVLVRSFVGEGRYEIAGRWPLAKETAVVVSGRETSPAAPLPAQTDCNTRSIASWIRPLLAT